MPRFVVLEHDWPSPHFDLMLEWGGVLRSWRLTNPPSCGEIVGEAAPDHRLAYLDYEGPVSGGRGSVKRWDAGDYALLNEIDGVEIECRGQRLIGRLRVRLVGNGSGVGG